MIFVLTWQSRLPDIQKELLFSNVQPAKCNLYHFEQMAIVDVEEPQAHKFM